MFELQFTPRVVEVYEKDLDRLVELIQRSPGHIIEAEYLTDDLLKLTYAVEDYDQFLAALIPKVKKGTFPQPTEPQQISEEVPLSVEHSEYEESSLGPIEDITLQRLSKWKKFKNWVFG